MPRTQPITITGAPLERLVAYLARVPEVNEYVAGVRDALALQGIPPEAHYRLVIEGISLVPDPPVEYTAPEAAAAPAPRGQVRNGSAHAKS